MRFEAWSGDMLIGLIAAYCNDPEQRVAYVSSVSVLTEWMGKGVAAYLMKQCIDYAKLSGMKMISLEVASNNVTAVSLYEKYGFIAIKVQGAFVIMNLLLNNNEE